MKESSRMLSRFLGVGSGMIPVLGLLSCILFGDRAFAELLTLKTFQSFSRLVVAIDPVIPAELHSSAKGFQLILKGITTTELGLQGRSPYAGVKDQRVKNIQIKEVGRDVHITGQWVFPEGTERLAKPIMDAFDYRAHHPMGLHVDFWVRRGPTALEVEEKSREKSLAESQERAKADAQKRAERRLASAEFNAEIEDLSRFCRLPLNEVNEVFLPLLPAHTKFPFQRYFSATTPDTHFAYYEPQINTRDAQYVRLALKLYREGNFGLTMRTLDFLEAEFPKSPFRLEMRFLRANVLIKLGIKSHADQLLSQLIFDAGGTAIALHTAVYRALKQIESGSHLAALESFLWLINKYPEHRLMWVFHMGAAEALYSMKQTDRAQKEYQWVVENGPSEFSKSEAALRIGDLFLERFQYDQALAYYYRAIQSFKDNADSFPTVHLNRAESLYGLNQFEKAESAYLDFLKKYPAHPVGWRATYRLGEIYGRREGKKNLDLSRHWFYETINLFPYSPGTTLARMRLLPCGDHGGFNLQSAVKFFEEDASQFNGSGEVLMARYREMKALSYVRTLVSYNEDKRAIEVAGKELLQLGNIPTRPILGNLLNAVFRKYVLHLLDSGSAYEALAFYRKHADTIPRAHAGPVSPDYILRLSQAASDLGLGSLASNLNQAYKTQMAIRAKGGTNRAISSVEGIGKSGQARGMIDITQVRPPPLEEGETRLRLSLERFTEAKALWKSKGYEAKAKIRELLSVVTQESRYSFERELILGRLAESENNTAEALRHAVSAQILEPQLIQSDEMGKGGAPKEHEAPAKTLAATGSGVEPQVTPTPLGETGSSKVPRSIRLHSWIAYLTAGAGDSEVALEVLRKFETRLRGLKPENSDDPPQHPSRVLGLPAPLDLSAVLVHQAEILEKKEAWREAAKTFERAVNENLGGNHARFQLARLLLKAGDAQDRKRAFEELENLAKYVPAASPNGLPPPPHPDVASGKVKIDFWNRLARETLSDEQSRQSLKPENAKEGRP